MVARDGIIQSCAVDFCPSLGPYLKGLVENFRAGLYKLVNGFFRADVFSSEFHTDNAIEAMTLRASENALSDSGDGPS